MGRGGRSGGNLFGGGLEDDVPSLEDLIPGITRSRPRARRRPVATFGVRRGPVSPLPVRRRGLVATPRRGLLGLRVALVCGLFLLGVLMAVSGAVGAADGYGAAATLAAAPACPAGTDLVADTADCVGDRVLSAQGGAFSDTQEDSLDLAVSPEDGYDLFPDYPANAAFDQVLGDDLTYPVRAEFWEGNIVALTAARGDDVQTVTTDQNPANVGGVGLGTTLLGFGLAELAVLLLIAVRAFRYRWLRPGLGLRLTVSALIVSCFGSVVTGGCLMTQPARVLLALSIGPSLILGVILLTWFSVYRVWRRPAVRGTLRRPI